MPRRCVVAACSNATNDELNISLHNFPKDEKQQRLWEKQVKNTRRNWSLNNPRTTYICSCHFQPEDFEETPTMMAEFGLEVKKRKVLKVTAVPRIKSKTLCSKTPAKRPRLAALKREKHRILREALEESAKGTGNDPPACKDVSCQTDEEDQWIEKRSVGTQLSMRTLQNVGSKVSTAVQANVQSRDLGVGTTTFPLENLQLFLQPAVTRTSSKRLRLEMEEEHD